MSSSSSSSSRRSFAPLHTARLRLDELDERRDAAFILSLYNEASTKRGIGDRGLSTLDDARRYLRNGPLSSYREHGFGLWRVCVRRDGDDDGERDECTPANADADADAAWTSVGVCGLLRRASLHGRVDLGFATAEAYHRRGYTLEASRAVLAWAHEQRQRQLVFGVVDDDDNDNDNVDDNDNDNDNVDDNVDDNNDCAAACRRQRRCRRRRRRRHRHEAVLAIVSPDNVASRALCERLGMRTDGTLVPGAGGDDTLLYSERCDENDDNDDNDDDDDDDGGGGGDRVS